jgi:HK97 family phage prohead protease
MDAPGDILERRLAVELRVAKPRIRAAGGAALGIGRICGLAAPFNVPTQIGGFTETIRPGAFAASLAANADIRALVDHCDDKLLGRTRSGTLSLMETRNGLAFEIDVPNTTLGRDVWAMAKRGDLSGCSFGFTVPPGGDAWPERDKRELRSVNLAEISILHRLPAYSQTEISARARALGRAEADARLRRLVLESL